MLTTWTVFVIYWFFLEEYSRTENESFQKKRKWLAGSGEWGRKRRHIDASRSSALYESYYQYCTIEDAQINHSMWFSINLPKWRVQNLRAWFSEYDQIILLIYRDVKSSYCNRVVLSFSRDRSFISNSVSDMHVITSLNALHHNK